jgi:hypothetical protein
MRWLLSLIVVAAAAAPVKSEAFNAFQRLADLKAEGFGRVQAAMSASSRLCEGKGAKARCHAVAHLSDGDVATSWCEGAKGPGVGEQLTLTFDREVTVAGLDLKPYFGKSFKLAAANTRPRRVTVSVPGGVAQAFDLEDVVATVEVENEDRPKSTRDEPCGDDTCASRDERLPNMHLVLVLPAPVKTKVLVLRFEEVYPDAKAPDLCVAELRAYGK